MPFAWHNGRERCRRPPNPRPMEVSSARTPLGGSAPWSPRRLRTPQPPRRLVPRPHHTRRTSRVSRDIARGFVASVHAQALDSFEVQQLADLIDRRSAPAIEYVDAARWSIITAEEAIIRVRLLGLRSTLGWEKIHARLELIDPRLARRFRARHMFLHDMAAQLRLLPSPKEAAAHPIGKAPKSRTTRAP